jgi:hypothetical protein
MIKRGDIEVAGLRYYEHKTLKAKGGARGSGPDREGQMNPAKWTDFIESMVSTLR